MLPARSLLVVGVLASLAAGCDSGGPVTERDVVGDYVATSFVLSGVGPSGGVDLLALGGTFGAGLSADGRFSARLYVPAGTELTEDGAEIDDSFGGTFTVRSGSVLFFHSEDYFMRDLDWTYEGGELRASPSPLSTGVGYEVVLERQ